MYLTDMTAHDVRAGLRSSLSETSRSFPFVGVEGVYTRVGDPLFPHCRLLTRGGEGGVIGMIINSFIDWSEICQGCKIACWLATESKRSALELVSKEFRTVFFFFLSSNV